MLIDDDPARREKLAPSLIVRVSEGATEMQSQLSLTVGEAAVSGTRVSAIGQALLAATLGVFLLWGVGFSQIDVVHNAAHDTRHSNAFPCH